MRVLVCGSRDYTDKDYVYNVLSALYEEGEFEVISGMARGVDSFAHDWAEENGVPCLEFPADWSKYGRRAGPIRNQQMLDEGKPEWVLAFPTGGRLNPKSGTGDMVRRARKAGVPVEIY